MSARIELDLRLGAATRMQTMALQNMIPTQGEERGRVIRLRIAAPNPGIRCRPGLLGVRNFVPGALLVC